MRFESASVETTRAKPRPEIHLSGQNQPLIMHNQANIRVFRLKTGCHCAAQKNIEKMAVLVGFCSISSRLRTPGARMSTTND
jgi:hypothetical protein